MKVLFVHPQIRQDQPPQHPPYGLLQLIGLTDELGYKVDLLDNNAFRLPLDAVRQEINDYHSKAEEVAKTENQRFTEQLLSLDLTDSDSFPRARELQLKIHENKKLLQEGLIRSDQSWDVIGISGLITQYKFIKKLLPVLREKHPDAIIVGGGGFLTSMPREMMKWLPELDIGCIGEAYATWPEVLEYVESQNWKKVKGLVYRDGSNVKFSAMRPLLTEPELDELPFPAFEHSEVKTYLMHSQIPYSPESMLTTTRRLDVLTSYGCPRLCSFCFHNGSTPFCQGQIYNKKVKGKPFRQHSPGYVVNLIQHLRMTYGVNFVSFIDENMTVNRKWFLEFCNLLADSGLATLMNWGMVCHTGTVDAQLLQKARDVGCVYISYGGETANEEMLKNIGKGQTKKQMAAAIQATQNAGINAIMSFIIGFPEMTIDTTIEDLQFFIDNQVHANPFFLQPYPGSKLYDEYKDTIIKQYRTFEEQEFLEEPTVYNFRELGWDLRGDSVTVSSIKRDFSLLKAKIDDLALERWVSDLDDAVRLSANLTKFDDVTLAGLRYLVSTGMPDLASKTWDMKRLFELKQFFEARK